MAPIHPLFGAGLRVDRAAEHLAELREQLQRWADLHSEQVGLALEGRTVKWKSELPVEELGRASMVIGDVLFNLGAALDYLVYVLAVGANKGRHVGGTQFPIEDDEDVFRGRVTGTHPATGKPVKQFLRKVTPVAAARIRQLQPFAGCVWTTELRELSNPDKHRALNALSSRAEWVGSEPTPTETDERLVLSVEGHFDVEVTFTATGANVVAVLETFEREVRATVEFFKPGFKPR